MYFCRLIVLLSCLSMTGTAYSGMNSAWKTLVKSRGKTENYPAVIKALVDNKLYFSSIPYIKEYLFTTKRVTGKKLGILIDEVISHVGIKQFEYLPESILKRSKIPMLQYIMAKKLFRTGKYKKALSYIGERIPPTHPTKPFALLLEASIQSIRKKYTKSINTYKRCISYSETALRGAHLNRKRQLKINRDYCIVGISRTYFAAGKYQKAHTQYLDLNKRSHIWPEILFEEAWNSFYLRDYNRTLGKLVSYKAPILRYIFNPEVEILTALTYLELCLWDDVQTLVDKFYKKHNRSYKNITSYLKRNKSDYKYYYHLMKAYTKGSRAQSPILNRILSAVSRDPAFLELFDSFYAGKVELERVNNLENRRFKQILNINLKESLLFQRNLIGGYIRRAIFLYRNQLSKSLEDMSYINLEILSRRKDSLYYPEKLMNRTRGDVKHIKRNDKQYFWTFNGEFWADELGDYVFTLKSECSL